MNNSGKLNERERDLAFVITRLFEVDRIRPEDGIAMLRNIANDIEVAFIEWRKTHDQKEM